MARYKVRHKARYKAIHMTIHKERHKWRDKVRHKARHKVRHKVKHKERRNERHKASSPKGVHLALKSVFNPLTEDEGILIYGQRHNHFRYVNVSCPLELQEMLQEWNIEVSLTVLFVFPTHFRYV